MTHSSANPTPADPDNLPADTKTVADAEPVSAANEKATVKTSSVAFSQKLINFFELISFSWFIPFIQLARGDDPRQQIKQIWLMIGTPIAAFLLFLLLWNAAASKIETSLGAIPGPSAVWEEVGNLVDEHYRERDKKTAFYERQQARNAAKLAENPEASVKIRGYTGKPTFPEQILTSLYTVFTGFIVATLIAVPLGIVCGLSKTVYTALNPLIQIFKPVSPLAWLPIVTLVVSATYDGGDGAWFTKSFLTSAITVTLCSLWPTLINTALGVASIDKDLMNVSRVLQLSWPKTIFKIVIPSSLPLIFTGLRLSLGVGWMVLIAAEMLAQNPGLGKFVWDEFQNGSSHSLGKIIVAVFVVGLIGFLLDRVMLTLQKIFSYGEAM